MDEGRKTILVVDDEPDVLTYYSALLEDGGYSTVTASDGQEALDRVNVKAPDLVCLDITMPHKSGVRFYREMKENSRYRDIPIIIVTGLAEEFQNFISNRRQVPPPEGYFCKPVDEKALLETIRKLLG